MEEMSRRRIVFRPPQARAEPTTSTATLDAPLEEMEEERKRSAKSWTFDDTMGFYEGIKQHGRDFDGVVRVMTKKKINKNKDQTRNYYFNSLKILKQLLSLNDDDLGDIPRDAKELFLCINSLEYKKRTNNGKIVPEKVRELLFDGTTNVRVNKKTIVIRTPPCIPLINFFTSHRKVDRFPSDITVIMKPRTFGDSSEVMEQRQNPMLKIKFSTNDRVSRLLELLRKKWKPKGQVRLWMDYGQEVGRLTAVVTDTSPYVSLSLNKLKKELEEVRKQKPQKNKPTYTVLYPKPFTITDEILADGICENNVGEAIFAELYCTSGMTGNVELKYSFDKQTNSNTSWQILVDLLGRDYGEGLGCGRKDDESSRKRDRVVDDSESNDSTEPLAKIATSSHRKPHSAASTPDMRIANDVELSLFSKPTEAASTSKKTQKQPKATVERVKASFECPTSSVVRRENNEFAAEMAMLLEKSRMGRGPRKYPYVDQFRNTVDSPRYAEERNDISPITEQATTSSAHLAQPQETRQLVIIKNVPTTTATRVEARTATRVVVEQTRENKQFATKAAKLLEKKKHETEMAPNVFLESLKQLDRTPEKSRGPTTSDNAGSARKSMGANEDEGSKFFDRLFGDVSLTPSKCGSHGADATTSDGFHGFPADVEQSVVEMMSQDSQDYVQNFQSLATRIYRPNEKK